MDADGEIGSGTPDSTPPVLNGLTILATTVTILGEIEVTVDTSDDVSGLRSGDVIFCYEETGQDLYLHVSSEYWDAESEQERTYVDGMLYGTLAIDQYVESGTFVVESVSLYSVVA